MFLHRGWFKRIENIKLRLCLVSGPARPGGLAFFLEALEKKKKHVMAPGIKGRHFLSVSPGLGLASAKI